MGTLALNREKEKTWTLLFAPGSQTNFAECPNVQKRCTGNILAEFFFFPVNLIYCNLIIMHANLESSSV